MDENKIYEASCFSVYGATNFWVVHVSDRKQEATVTDLISNLGKASNYSTVSSYQMGEAYDGLYSASYQFPGCFYSSSPYYRYVYYLVTQQHTWKFILHRYNSHRIILYSYYLTSTTTEDFITTAT